MITRDNAAETAIAWAATNKSTCVISTRTIPPIQSMPVFWKWDYLAQQNQVTITVTAHEYRFTYDPERNPPTEL